MVWFRSLHKVTFYPPMTNPAWVRCCAHVYAGSWARGTVTGIHVAVFIPGEMSQFIKSYKIELFSLIVSFVADILHVPKIDFRPGRKSPHMVCSVVSSFSECPFVHILRFINQFRELLISFSE